MDPKKLGSYGRTGPRGAKSLQLTGEGPHLRQWANKHLEAGNIPLERTYNDYGNGGSLVLDEEI